MLKRVVIASLLSILAAGTCGVYIYFTGRKAATERAGLICEEINICRTDSLSNDLISCSEILSIVTSATPVMGIQIDSIRRDRIEAELLKRGEIHGAEAFTTHDGRLFVNISQRSPVVKFLGAKGTFYSDTTGYIFPAGCRADVPAVTGNIPLEGKQGFCRDCERQWLEQIIALARRLESDPYWGKQVEQIDIDSKGDINLYIDSDRQKIIFGSTERMEEKFRLLETFYTHILPSEGGERYTTVNLKYKNQIVCR